MLYWLAPTIYMAGVASATFSGFQPAQQRLEIDGRTWAQPMYSIFAGTKYARGRVYQLVRLWRQSLHLPRYSLRQLPYTVPMDVVVTAKDLRLAVPA